MPRFFLLTLLVLLTKLVWTRPVHASFDQPAIDSLPKRVLFINQVRGNECCDPGSKAALVQQLKAFEDTHLPATFALRYDALTDPEYQELFKKQAEKSVEFGVFLEITPKLAADAQVTYPGALETWYHADQVYSIGYTPDERTKLIDVLFEQYKTVFGKYPSFMAGWLVDTQTINYARERYNTQIHEITREQWGTDSYTLSGGPVHYPYLADHDWAFLPSKDATVSEHTLMLRQTISDPLRNYGDPTSAFTSQPNDYTRDGKTFSYAKALIDTMLTQSQNPYAFALLGLENSMGQEYQDEYVRQIQLIGEYAQKKPEMKVLTASDFFAEFTQNWAGEQITTIRSALEKQDDEDTQAIWVNTPVYRLRLVQKGTAVRISDLRLYQMGFPDPYTNTQAQALGFWITPFLIDGSRFQHTQPLTYQTQLSWQAKAKRMLSTFFSESLGIQRPFFLKIHSDIESDAQPQAIRLPNSSLEPWQLSRTGPTSTVLRYQNEEGQEVLLSFFADHWTLSGQNPQATIDLKSATLMELPFLVHEQRSASSQTLSWKTPDQTVLWNLQVDCTPRECSFLPETSTTVPFAQLTRQYYPYLFPEPRTDRQLSEQYTQLWVEHPYVIGGEKPVRLTLLPKDEYGYLIHSAQPVLVSAVPPINDVSLTTTIDGKVIIDVIENQIGKYLVTVQLGEVKKNHTVFVSPNCQKEQWYCITHPIQASWYLKNRFFAYLKSENKD